MAEHASNMIESRQRFYEKGPEVDAIRHDGSEESAQKVIDWAAGIMQADIVPRGGFNNDPTSTYVAIKTQFGVGYVGPGDWCVYNSARQVEVLGNTDFRRKFVEITGVV